MRLSRAGSKTRGAAAALLAACVVTAGGLTRPWGPGSTLAAYQYERAGRDRAIPAVTKGQEDPRARWRRLRAEFIKIALSLAEPLDRPDRLLAFEQEMRTEKAKAAFERARLARQIAEIDLTGYTEGRAKSELGAAKREIDEAEKASQRAHKRLERIKQVRDQINAKLEANGDDLTASDVLTKFTLERTQEADELALERCRFDLEQARLKHDVLTKFTRKARQKELEAEVAQRRSDELARQQEWDLAKWQAQRDKKPPETELLTVLAEAVRSPGHQPPWERKGVDLEEYLDQFEVKLAEARTLQDRARERQEMSRFVDLTTRILDRLAKPASD